MERYAFDTVKHALSWSTEILRRRRFPKLTKMYQEIVLKVGSPKARSSLQSWYGEHGFLPTEYEDKFSFAMDVYMSVSALEGDLQQVIRLAYWGDYADDARLCKALKMQEYYRRQGIRVRISYRYSLRQIGLSMGVSHQSVKRLLKKAEKKLETLLLEKDLLVGGMRLPKSESRLSQKPLHDAMSRWRQKKN